MNVLLIAFDAHKLTSLKLRPLIESSFPGTWRGLHGAYIVRSPLTSPELRDMLKPALSDNDELLVVTLAPGGWTWRGNTEAGVEWLQKNA